MSNLFTFVPIADNRRALQPNLLTSRATCFEELVCGWITESQTLQFEREQSRSCSYLSVSFKADGEALGKACLHTSTAFELCPTFSPLDETLMPTRQVPFSSHPWVKERNSRLGIHGRRAPAECLMELTLSYALSSSGSAHLSLWADRPRFIRLGLKFSGSACSWSEQFLLVRAKIGVRSRGFNSQKIERESLTGRMPRLT